MTAPVIDGFGNLADLECGHRLQKLPVIVIRAEHDDQFGVERVECGDPGFVGFPEPGVHGPVLQGEKRDMRGASEQHAGGPQLGLIQNLDLERFNDMDASPGEGGRARSDEHGASDALFKKPPALRREHAVVLEVGNSGKARRSAAVNFPRRKRRAPWSAPAPGLDLQP